jgi:hypothetical protein
MTPASAPTSQWTCACAGDAVSATSEITSKNSEKREKSEQREQIAKSLQMRIGRAG